MIVGCSSSSNNGAPDGGSDSGSPVEAGVEGGTDAGGDAAPAGPLGFTPSNFDLSGLDLTKAGDVVLSGPNCFIQPAANNPGWSCTDTNKYVMKTVTLSDQSKMVVYVVKSLRIEASTVLTCSGGLGGGGALPFAIVALDTMTLVGSIKVVPGYAGGASNADNQTKGGGPGGGGGGPDADKKGGGGASFCGVGGQGGVEAGSGLTPYAKSTSYGTPELIPLVGGSAGGRSNGGGTNNGAGGGAVQLVAGTSIDLQAGAFISVPGAGGSPGGLATTQEGGGAGSGGAILLEAPTVTIAGALAANGGGGGGGAGGDAGGATSGDPGHDSDATPAVGGNGGGAGSAGDGADGANAALSGPDTAPGGGGGAGRIRINTQSGAAALGGATLSPSAKTSCVTQGTLKK